MNIQYRTSKKVLLTEAVESYVARNLGPNEAKKIVAKGKLLDEARNEITALNFSDDVYMLKDTLFFYYKGLQYLKDNFPFGDNHEEKINIIFSWKDSVTGKEYNSNELELEMNSVLFNLGAVFSNIGACTPITKDSIK